MKPQSVTALLLALALGLGCASAAPEPSATAMPPASSAATPPSEAPTRATAATAETESAATTSAAELAPSDPLPFDPAVRRGQLPNGLSYYVRANHRPEKRAALRLVVNAGSVVEDDDQRGLAHFVEHMAFNGTEHFEKQELVDYLEKIGMRFGPDVNAYTSFDETVYMLEVPTDDPEILATGFQILEDWAHRVTFEGEEIDKERGVVTEEWRQGRGAGGRIRDRQLPVTFHGSRYAERLVIGDPEVLQHAPHDALRRFYRDWYRPDLMAVIAVGDFDAAVVERQIRDLFAALTRRDQARERVDFPIPDHAPTLQSVVTDPEATSISVQVGYKRPPVEVETVADLRRSMVDGLYHNMMNDRLRELTLLSDPPFQSGFAGAGRLGRTKSVYQLSARVRDGGVVRGLETLLTEAKRVETHGFASTELERAKTDVLRAIDRAHAERDKQESVRYASQYVAHFLERDPVPAIETVRDLYHRLTPTITLAEVNARADQWISEENRIILVSGPDKPEAGIPGEQQLLATFDEVDQVAVTPWVDRTRDEPLVAELPKPGAVVSDQALDELGVHRWKLANGVTVLLKPTDFKNDEVLLSAYSPGGHSLASDEDYLSASQASAIVSTMGLGAFDRVELGKALTGKVASVRPFVGELSEGLGGGASPEDLETLFQLVYLHFTGARRDEGAFAAYRSALAGQLENQEASPLFWFNSKWNEVAFGDHPRRQMFTSDRLDEVELDRALAVYHDRFADASDFLFTLVGSFDLERVRPMVERWLGGLPSTGRRETWRDVDAYADEGGHTFEVLKGIEPKSNVRIVYHGFADWTPLDDHLASAAGQALAIRLREVLREDMGGVYGVGVGSSLSRWPRGRYNSTISFGCDPDRVEELIAAALAELEAFKTDGPSAEVVAKVRETQRRSRETALKQNRFWVSALESHEVNGLPLTDILDFERRLEAITSESLRAVTRRYFDSGSFIQGVLYPESPEVEGSDGAR